ncbi:MAG: glycosyltransferase family 39 protein [Elusimicrobiota bacterium]
MNTYKQIKQLVILFIVMLIIRLAVALLMGPGADEAYYYVYSLHPDTSYFDHPPFVALLGGLIPGITGIVSPLTLRLLPIILFSIAVYIFFLTAKLLLKKSEAVMAVSLFMVVPMFFLSGTMLLPDAGLIFFWVLGLYLTLKTLEAPTHLNWIILGVVAGFGMLSKYTAAFLFISGFIFIILDKDHRKLFLTPGPYLALLAAVITFSPVLAWNYSHGFVSFLFQGKRVGMGGIKLRYFYQSFFGQMGYILPFVFIPCIYYGIKSVILIFKNNSRYERFLFCYGALPVTVFMAASLFKRVLPHWPVIGYISLTLAAGKFYESLKEKKKPLFNLYAIGHSFIVILLITAALLQIYTGIIFNRELPESGIEKKSPVKDISIDIIGWNFLEKHLKEAGYRESDIFLFTHKWYVGGQIAFAVRGRYPVMCLSSIGDARGFSIWQDQEKEIGKDGLFICTSKFFLDPSQRYSGYFDSIELAETIPVMRNKKLVKNIYVYKCRNFRKPYPVN